MNDRINQVFKQFAAEQFPGARAPGFAAAVIKDRKVIFKQGYGKADLNHDIDITPETVFHIASISKQFTAMAIMLLVEAGKLKLEDHVDDHVQPLHVPAGTKPDERRMTIGDLLHHTSGIRDQWALLTMAGWRQSNDLVTEEDVRGLVSGMKTLDFNPRDDIIYSNTGYTLASLIVKKVTGMPLSEFARNRIFQPLNMHHTVIIETHGQIVPNRAYGYRRVGDRYETFMPTFDLTGPTNLLTTVEDLARWDHNFEERIVGGERALSLMQKPARLSNGSLAELMPGVHYGLGLELTKFDDLDIVEHAGTDAGFRSHLMRLPTKHLSVVILCNNALPDDVSLGTLARKVVRVCLDDDRPLVEEVASAPPAGPRPSLTHAQLAEYAGEYHSEEIGTTYQIALLQNSSLVIRRPKYPETILTPSTNDCFLFDGFSQVIMNGEVRFTRDAHRKVKGFLFNGSHGMRRIQAFPFTRLA